MNKNEKFIFNFVKTLKKIFKNKKIFLHEPFFRKIDEKIVSNCIKSGQVSTATNSYYKKFNQHLKKFTKAKNIFLTSSGTNALHLGLNCLNLEKDNEIMLSSIGFVASLNTILYLKCIPHFLDCSKQNLGIDYEKLKFFLENNCKLNKKKECVNLRTKRVISVIIVTHVYGYPAEIDKICKICKKYNIRVIEDAAEALGSYYKGRHLGTFGDLGILSFNGNKIITTGGGGAVLTNNKKYFDKVSYIGNLARGKNKNEIYFSDIGYNYKMPNLNASLGYSQFKNIKFFLKYKTKLNRLYDNQLYQFDNFLKLLKNAKYIKSNFWLQTIILKNSNLRNKLIKECRKNNIFLKPIWRPLHKLKYVKKKYCQNDLSNVSFLENRVINLPSGLGILKKN